MSDNIKVAVRMRPLIPRELESKASLHWQAHSKQTICQSTNSSFVFHFDRVFDGGESNETVYRDIGSSIVESVLEGMNGTIFAYGQTSSGKTYTMQGTNDGKTEGIIQCAIQDLFKEIQDMPEREFLLRVSYMEIYNESVLDLLTPQNENLKLQEDSDGQIKVCKLSEHFVQESNQVLNLMKKGNRKRRIGETKMNDKSSRSHSIFRMIIESRLRDEEDAAVNVSHFNLVDLAGSERAGQTGATGARFKESININKSLLMLSQVISQLSEKDQYINYRDSKITRILQNSLGGNARTAIICTITPAILDETLSTLKFAERAKSIKNKPQVNEVLTEQALLKRYANKIKTLTEELKATKQEKAQQHKDLQTEIQGLKEKFVFQMIPEMSKSNRRETWGGCLDAARLKQLMNTSRRLPSLFDRDPSDSLSTTYRSRIFSADMPTVEEELETDMDCIGVADASERVSEVGSDIRRCDASVQTDNIIHSTPPRVSNDSEELRGMFKYVSYLEQEHAGYYGKELSDLKAQSSLHKQGVFSPVVTPIVQVASVGTSTDEMGSSAANKLIENTLMSLENSKLENRTEINVTQVKEYSHTGIVEDLFYYLQNTVKIMSGISFDVPTSESTNSQHKLLLSMFYLILHHQSRLQKNSQNDLLDSSNEICSNLNELLLSLHSEQVSQADAQELVDNFTEKLDRFISDMQALALDFNDQSGVGPRQLMFEDSADISHYQFQDFANMSLNKSPLYVSKTCNETTKESDNNLRIPELTEKNEKLGEKISELEKEVANLLQSNNFHLETISNLNLDLQNQMQKTTRLEQNISEYLCKISSLETEALNYTKSLERTEANYLEEIASIKSDLRSKTEEISRLEQNNSENLNRISCLEQESVNASNSITQLGQTNSEQLQTISRLTSEISSKIEGMELLEQNTINLKKSISDMEKTSNDYLQRLTCAEESNSQLLSTVSNLGRNNDQCALAIAELTDKNNSYSKSISDLEHKLHTHLKTISDFQFSVDQKEKQIRIQNDKIGILEQKIFVLNSEMSLKNSVVEAVVSTNQELKLVDSSTQTKYFPLNVSNISLSSKNLPDDDAIVNELKMQNYKESIEPKTGADISVDQGCTSVSLEKILEKLTESRQYMLEFMQQNMQKEYIGNTGILCHDKETPYDDRFNSELKALRELLQRLNFFLKDKSEYVEQINTMLETKTAELCAMKIKVSDLEKLLSDKQRESSSTSEALINLKQQILSLGNRAESFTVANYTIGTSTDPVGVINSIQNEVQGLEQVLGRYRTEALELSEKLNCAEKKLQLLAAKDNVLKVTKGSQTLRILNESMNVTLSSELDLFKEENESLKKIINDMRSNFDSTLSEVNRKHAVEKEHMHSKLRGTVKSLEEKYEEEISKLSNDDFELMSSRISEITGNHHKVLSDKEKQYKEELEKTETNHKMRVTSLKEEHEAALSRIEKSLAEEIEKRLEAESKYSEELRACKKDLHTSEEHCRRQRLKFKNYIDNEKLKRNQAKNTINRNTQTEMELGTSEPCRDCSSLKLEKCSLEKRITELLKRDQSKMEAVNKVLLEVDQKKAKIMSLEANNTQMTKEIMSLKKELISKSSMLRDCHCKLLAKPHEMKRSDDFEAMFYTKSKEAADFSNAQDILNLEVVQKAVQYAREEERAAWNGNGSGPASQIRCLFLEKELLKKEKELESYKKKLAENKDYAAKKRKMSPPQKEKLAKVVDSENILPTRDAVNSTLYSKSTHPYPKGAVPEIQPKKILKEKNWKPVNHVAQPMKMDTEQATCSNLPYGSSSKAKEKRFESHPEDIDKQAEMLFGESNPIHRNPSECKQQ